MRSRLRRRLRSSSSATYCLSASASCAGGRPGRASGRVLTSPPGRGRGVGGVVGRAAAPGDVAVAEGGDQRDQGRVLGAAPHRGQRGVEAGQRGVPQTGGGQPVAGRRLPVVQTGAGLLGHGGGDRVVEQRGEHGHRHRPPLATAGRRGSGPRTSRAAAPAGTAWSCAPRGRRGWAGRRPRARRGRCAPAARSSRRTRGAAASAGRRARSRPRPSPGPRPRAPPVRCWSRCCQTRCRPDFQPVSRPACTGEFANAATIVGPTVCSSRQRRVPSAASCPMSRLTCRAAVLVIITGPISALSGPADSK